MTPEIWTIIGVGIALASLMLTGLRSLRADITELRRDLGKQIGGVRDDLGQQIAELRADVGQLRERMAHLEGLLEGLREAIAHNRAA